MKPQQADMAYCIKHRVFVNGLLEGRGWQAGDRFIRPLTQSHPRVVEGINHADVMNQLSVADEIWIPTSDDVLGMLDERNTMPALESNVQKDERDLFWIARAGRSKSGWQKTPLIALLELLRAVEGKG